MCILTKDWYAHRMWSILNDKSEPKPKRKLYHLKDAVLLCDFYISFVLIHVICFLNNLKGQAKKMSFYVKKHIMLSENMKPYNCRF